MSSYKIQEALGTIGSISSNGYEGVIIEPSTKQKHVFVEKGANQTYKVGDMVDFLKIVIEGGSTKVVPISKGTREFTPPTEE